ARWTNQINTDPESPFRGLINFGFTDTSAFIPENVMFQVVSKFMKPARRFRAVFNETPEWSDPQYRMRAFFVLWTAIKDMYPAAWEEAQRWGQQGNPPKPIFMKATMLV